MIAEHRCFLTDGAPVGLRQYRGDPLIFPDATVIRAALAAFPSAPAGCAVDFGVTSSGDTVVVEVNDGYAIGAYGPHPVLYAKLIAARWTEIAETSAA